MEEQDSSRPATGSFEGLGLNKKPKKKNPVLQGLIQTQQSMQEQKKGTLASMAFQRGSLGTADQGIMTEAPDAIRKKKNGGY